MGGAAIGQPALVVPENWESIEEFSSWYKGCGCPLRLPDDACIHKTDVTMSMVVFRQGDYQAELYMIAPRANIPRHSHPMRQVIMWLGGWLSTWVQDVDDAKPWQTRHQGFLSATVADGQQHAFTTNEKGGLLVVLERWRPDMKKSSATLAYEGEELGPIHLATLRSLGLRADA